MVTRVASLKAFVVCPSHAHFRTCVYQIEGGPTGCPAQLFGFLRNKEPPHWLLLEQHLPRGSLNLTVDHIVK